MNDQSSGNSDGSSMVMVMKELYLSPGNHLDFTYGYPERINPAWIKQLQTTVPETAFEDEGSAKKFVDIIEHYFLNLLQCSNINLAPTAGFAIGFMCDALIRNPGDEIILQDISFEPYPKIIESYKGKAVVVDREPDFAMSVQNIENAYTENTRAVIIVNPDNPAGLIYSENDMKELVRFCVEKNITLVIDYTFFEILPFGRKVPLITTFPESRQLSYILIGDTGKILGLKGSKFGALLYSDNWKEIIDDVVSNYLFQHDQYNLYLISSILADGRFPAYLKLLNAAIADNYLHIKNNLYNALKLLPLEATDFCLIDITAIESNDVAFAHSLMTKGVGVIPITYFYNDNKNSPGNLIRLSLARPLDEIEKFVEVINKLVAEM